MRDLSLVLDCEESIEVFVDICNNQAYNNTFCIHINSQEDGSAIISIPDKRLNFDLAKITISNNGKISVEKDVKIHKEFDDE